LIWGSGWAEGDCVGPGHCVNMNLMPLRVRPPVTEIQLPCVDLADRQALKGHTPRVPCFNILVPNYFRMILSGTVVPLLIIIEETVVLED
jgi:hypothetical protein